MCLRDEIVNILTAHKDINFAQLWLYLLEIDVTVTYEAISSQLESLEFDGIVTRRVGDTSLNDIWRLNN